MNYDDVAAAYFTRAVGVIPEPTVPQSPARRLRDALEPIATQGWWAREPMTRLADLGLGFFEAYVWGRAAALGTPSASVVVATFGVFEPGLLGGVYERGRAGASRDDVLAARADGASSAMAAVVDPDIADDLADTLLRALDGCDGMGRPLFSALRELPLPADPGGRLWRAAELVREHRGDGHLAVMVAAGLDGVEANVLTELWLGYEFGAYSGTRGWSAERLDQARTSLAGRGWLDGTSLSAAGVNERVRLETVTDNSQEQLVNALGDDLDRVVAAAGAISDRLLRVPAFPADPRKRAAG